MGSAPRAHNTRFWKEYGNIAGCGKLLVELCSRVVNSRKAPPQPGKSLRAERQLELMSIHSVMIMSN